MNFKKSVESAWKSLLEKRPVHVAEDVDQVHCHDLKMTPDQIVIFIRARTDQWY